MPTDKKYVIGKLDIIGKYLEILGENPFKTRAYSKGADALDASEFDLETLIKTGRLGNLDGIGAALKEKILDLYETGTCNLLEKLENDIPSGVGEMLKIKGLGPKKIAYVWQKMGLTSPGELLYACQENRLKEEKGFGQKSQDTIQAAIEFLQDQKGLFHYFRVKEQADFFIEQLRKITGNDFLFSEIGALRRCLPVLERAEFLCEASQRAAVNRAFSQSEHFAFDTANENSDVFISLSSKLQMEVHFADENFVMELFLKTGSPDFIEALPALPPTVYTSESNIFEALSIQFIPPEMREGSAFIQAAKSNRIPKLVELSDIKGLLHNHSTWSDGLHSIEEMAGECIKMGLTYFGISDHSQSAAYAGGLSQGRVEQQQIEVDKLNKKLAPFQILKGIESDILSNGDLDYSDSVLKTFDFVVASVHSGLNMDEDKATQRLLAAIENPFTHILGHPTGRLLLSRRGYPLNHKKIIEACAANQVAIEINANPYRLDIDWEWIPYALEKGVFISINPDAHKKGGLHDVKWGIAAARKGGLFAEQTLNALPLQEVLNFFKKTKG